MKFSYKTNWKTSPNPLTEKRDALEKHGHQILNLTVSNPTRSYFRYLNATLLRVLDLPENLVYDPDSHGLQVATKAVLAYYANQRIHLDQNQIFLTANTSEAYSFVFKLLMEPNESLLAPQPSYPILDYLAELNYVRVLRYPLHNKKRWAFGISEIENIIAQDTRAVLVVHPNNPTGNYVSPKEKTTLNTFCQKRDLAIIADEVFFDFTLNKKLKPQSFAANNDALTFTLSGISKILGLPQMKLSWIVVTGPKKAKNEAIRRLEIISDTYLSASTPAQHALPHWFRSQKDIQAEILERIRSNLDFVKASLAGQKKVQVLTPEGGWSVVLLLPESKSDEEWALELLEKENVLLHPGYLFDFHKGSYLVASLLTDTETFQEGIERIVEFACKGEVSSPSV